MKIVVNGVADASAFGQNSRPVSKSEQDQLFDIIVTLANFADEKGLQSVSDKLEETLDILLETDHGRRTEFATSRFDGVEFVPSERARTAHRALMTELKKARLRRAPALS